MSDGSRRESGSPAVHESPSPSPHLCKSKETLSCESCESFSHHVSSSRHFHSQPVLPDTCAQENSCSKSLMELLVSLIADTTNCQIFVNQCYFTIIFIQRYNRYGLRYFIYLFWPFQDKFQFFLTR